MLLTYVSVFVFWNRFPSRAGFLLVGGFAVAALVVGFLRAKANGYFVNRVDATLHGLVIADLAIETTIFEAFRLFETNAVVGEFHHNMNFLGCSTAFALLLGGHRWMAQRKLTTASLIENQVADGTAYGQARI